MGASSAPPPGAPDTRQLTFELSSGGGGFKKLLGGSGPSRLTLTPQEILVEHASALRAPLRFAPGSVAAATVDPGPASVGKGAARGRFPILHRLGPSQVVPKELGIMGWLWTSTDGSAFTVLGDEAPNVALVLSPPLAGYILEESFEPSELEELAKRAPLGEPAVFGLLLRAERVEKVRDGLDRYGL